MAGCQGESLSSPKQLRLWACDSGVPSARSVSGTGARSLPTPGDMCLDLPRLSVSPLPHPCNGVNTTQGSKSAGFMWIHKVTLRKCFEGVRLSPKAWRCGNSRTRGAAVSSPCFACCRRSQSLLIGGCTVGFGLYFLALDQVVVFCEKTMGCCLSLDVTTLLGVLLCFFSIGKKGQRESERVRI